MKIRNYGHGVVQKLSLVVALASVFAVVSTSSDSGASENASGAAIKIMTWSSYTAPTLAQPENLSAVKAGVDAINAAGGIKGHKIDLISCDTLNSPNGTTACSNEAIADHVTAVVGSQTVLQPQIVFPALQKAGIAYIGGDGITPNELQSPIAFSDSGIQGWFVGVAKQLESAKLNTPSAVECEIPSCSYTVQVIQGALKGSSVALVRTVVAPLSTTDFTAAAAQLVQGNVDSVIFAGSTSQLVGITKALREQGFNGPIALADVQLPSNFQTALGSSANGMLVTYLVVPPSTTSNPGIKKFRAQMAKYAPTASITSDTVRCWWGVQLFDAIATKAPALTAASILSTAKGLKPGEIVTGVTPPVPVLAKSPVKSLPGLRFDPMVIFTKIVKGMPVPQGNFVNPFKS